MTSHDELAAEGVVMKVKVGDWVRFYSNGRLVIGAVQYIENVRILGNINLHTDAGTIDVEDVYEVRSSKEQP